MMFAIDDIIHAYTRRQATKDGVLIDVTEAAAEMGFRLPVAMTPEAYFQFIFLLRVPKDMPEEARLRLFLSMLFVVLREPRHRIEPDLYRWEVQQAGNESTRQTITAKVVRGPDDDGKECLTVMMRWED